MPYVDKSILVAALVVFVLGFALGMVVASSILVDRHNEAVAPTLELIAQCEANLPRNQTCKLEAVAQPINK